MKQRVEVDRLGEVKNLTLPLKLVELLLHLGDRTVCDASAHGIVLRLHVGKLLVYRTKDISTSASRTQIVSLATKSFHRSSEESHVILDILDRPIRLLPLEHFESKLILRLLVGEDLIFHFAHALERSIGISFHRSLV